MDLSEGQFLTLRVLCSFLAALFAGNLVFAVHNTIRYLCALKIDRPLILLFYVLVYTSTTFRIWEFALKAVYPRNGWFEYAKGSTRNVETVALLATICLGFTLVVTMWHLAVSLEQILNEIGSERAKRKNLVVGVFASVCVLLYSVLESLLTIRTFGKAYIMYQDALLLVTFSVLTLTYFMTIVFLNSKMKQLRGNFEKEIKSVNR